MSPSAQGILALDVGGTDVKVALFTLPFDSVPAPRDVRRVPTAKSESDPGGALLAQVAQLREEYALAHPDVAIVAVGMSVPGIVDESAGIGIFSANLGWRDYSFADAANRLLGLPFALGHDVASASDAEVQLGAARGVQNVVVVPIGTGIAAGVFADGKRVRGGGYAGELGHVLVPGGEKCFCGATGCLETLASAAGIARRYVRLAEFDGDGTGSDDTGSDDTGTGGGPAEIGAKDVLERKDAGDIIAARVWQDAVDALAWVFASLVTSLGTQVFVIGGGLSGAGPKLTEPIARALDELLSFQPRPEIRIAELGPDAGLIGSALHAREKLAAVLDEGTGFDARTGGANP
ncbi:ROK family protein [Haematomicrobium sanguinis]|uniref:ROK family protein n=1 Tax=Haematomicrobium sanguinis TaxID=479106 RepID=UPI00068EDDD8|nr:ROK family protein [Haematomicrobium sanguinis]